jgi:hypothetical protein
MKGNAYVPFMLRRGDGSTLSLDFTAMGDTLDSRFTFTRSSTTSTYTNSSGLVATAGTNVPRFDYDPTTLTPRGLLLEGSAINLLVRSEDMATASFPGWGTRTNLNTTGISGQGSPDGATTAVKIIPNTTNGAHYLATGSLTLSNSVQYTLSVFVKPSGYGVFGLVTTNNQARASFTLATNSSSSYGLTSTRTITPYPNGWYRVSMSWTTTQTSMEVWLVAQNTQQDPVLSWSGNNTDSVTVWGAQLELGSSASSYIPTGISTVQRTADTCIAASTEFSSWFTGGTTGTFYADWYGGVRGITSTVRTVLSTSDVTGRHLHLQQTAATGNLKVADFTAANSVTTFNSITSGARTKGAFSFSGSTVNLTLNGDTVATSSSIAFSTAPTYLVLGGTSTDGSTITDATVLLNGSIRAIKYWPSVLPTATLQSLTA